MTDHLAGANGAVFLVSAALPAVVAVDEVLMGGLGGGGSVAMAFERVA